MKEKDRKVLRAILKNCVSDDAKHPFESDRKIIKVLSKPVHRLNYL